VATGVIDNGRPTWWCDAFVPQAPACDWTASEAPLRFAGRRPTRFNPWLQSRCFRRSGC